MIPTLYGLTDAVLGSIRWLEVLARSGAATSSPRSQYARQRAARALREAFQIASTGGSGARTDRLDELERPRHWRSAHSTDPDVDLRLNGPEGASAFLQPNRNFRNLRSPEICHPERVEG